MSAPLSPAARTASRTSVSPGTGSSRSSQCSWLSRITVACMVATLMRHPMEPPGPGRRRARTGILGGMALYDIPVHTLQGDDSSLGDYAGKTLLVVNVASKCGLTPQYEGLERLQKTYGDRGFSVVGFPSNQFMGQEPGTPEEIQQFCSTTYGVSFPLFEKIDVN